MAALEAQGTMPSAPLAKQGTMPTAPAPLEKQGTVAAAAPVEKQGTLPTAPPAAVERQGTVAAAPAPAEKQGTMPLPVSCFGGGAGSGPTSPTAGLPPSPRDGGPKLPPLEETSAMFRAQYNIAEHLGEGSFATVKRCQRKRDDRHFAAKIIEKRRVGVAELDSLLYEVLVMRELANPGHQTLILMHEAFEGPDELILVLDLIEGQTLFDRIIESKHYTESISSIISGNLFRGVQYMHSKDIMHRDLKPENLLMKRQRTHTPGEEGYILDMTEVVIADLGLASRPPSKVVCGSPAYVAPEVLMTQTGDCSYGTSCDVWSLGVIIYITFCGTFPFKGASQTETFNKILTSPLEFGHAVWTDASVDAPEFLTKLLDKDPDDRPTAAGALSLAWITGSGLKQPEKRAQHMETARRGLQRFRLREKVSVVMNVFRGARRLRLLGQQSSSPRSRARQQKQEAEGPAFMRYVKPASDTALLITCQSQTDPDKTHSCDLRLCSASARTRSDFALYQTCTCASKKVCRHLQYIYVWLFIGDRVAEIPPHCSELENRHRELSDKVAAFPPGDPPPDGVREQLEVYRSLSAVVEFLLHARDFKAAYEMVPDTDKKAILHSAHFALGGSNRSRPPEQRSPTIGPAEPPADDAAGTGPRQVSGELTADSRMGSSGLHSQMGNSGRSESGAFADPCADTLADQGSLMSMPRSPQ